jgi:putative DNA primase/helicase
MITSKHQQDSVGENRIATMKGRERYTKIPDSLKSCGNWLLYKLEKVGQKDGTERDRKVPYSANTGCKTDATIARNWTDFDNALAALDSNSSHAGLGFGISKGFIFIDLDECINPDTGEIAAWAAEVVARLDSYTEVSPSGDGLHILCRSEAALPAGGRKLDHIEMYDGGRYFTMTGDHVENTPATVETRTEELLALYAAQFGQSANTVKPVVVEAPTQSIAATGTDEEILLACRNAKNAAKFAKLFHAGDTSAYSGNWSNADAALCAFFPIARATRHRLIVCFASRH